MRLHSPSDLARLIKNARIEKSLTQQDVADAVGITRQSLARIERANGGVSFDTVIAVLEYLSITLEARTATSSGLSEVVAHGNNEIAAAAELAARKIEEHNRDALSGLRKSLSAKALEGLDLPHMRRSVLGDFGASTQARSALLEAGLAVSPWLSGVSGPLTIASMLRSLPQVPGSVISNAEDQVEADGVSEGEDS